MLCASQKLCVLVFLSRDGAQPCRRCCGCGAGPAAGVALPDDERASHGCVHFAWSSMSRSSLTTCSILSCTSANQRHDCCSLTA